MVQRKIIRSFVVDCSGDDFRTTPPWTWIFNFFARYTRSIMVSIHSDIHSVESCIRHCPNWKIRNSQPKIYDLIKWCYSARYDLEWRQCQGKRECQRSFRSNVIVQTNRHTHRGPTALPGPPKWSVETARSVNRVTVFLSSYRELKQHIADDDISTRGVLQQPDAPAVTLAVYELWLHLIIPHFTAGPGQRSLLRASANFLSSSTWWRYAHPRT